MRCLSVSLNLIQHCHTKAGGKICGVCLSRLTLYNHVKSVQVGKHMQCLSDSFLRVHISFLICYDLIIQLLHTLLLNLSCLCQCTILISFYPYC